MLRGHGAGISQASASSPNGGTTAEQHLDDPQSVHRNSALKNSALTKKNLAADRPPRTFPNLKNYIVISRYVN
jgi:hypothetical protein